MATADAGAAIFLPLIVRSPAVEEPREVVPSEIRAPVVEDVAGFIENLPHEDFEAETADSLARLQAHPEIKTAVVDGSCNLPPGGMIMGHLGSGDL